MSIDFNQRPIAGSGKFFTCEYCPVEFQFRQNRIQHTATHFKSKSCTICHKLLLCINGDWYELHASPVCDKNDNLQNTPNETYTETKIEIEVADCESVPNLNVKSEVSDADSVDNVNEDSDMFNTLSMLEPDIEVNTLPSMARPLNIPVAEIQEIGQAKIQQKNKSSAIKRKEFVSNENPFTDHRPMGSCTCEICGGTLVSFSSLRKHILYQHLNKAQVTCGECGETFKTPGNLKKHRRRRHSGSIMKTPKILQEKILRKNKPPMIKRNGPESKKATITNHQPSNAYECKVCKKILANWNSLRKHMFYQHVNMEKFSCDACGKAYSMPGSLTKHKRIHHPACPELKPLAKKRKKHISNPAQFIDHRPSGSCICDCCNKTLHNFSALKAHIRYHHIVSKDRLRCDECDQTFCTKTNLAKHKNIHRNYKPYVCTFCARGFNQLYALQEHEQVHKGNMPSCTICGKQYINKSNLRKHMIIHSNERPFRCNVDGCEWAFVNKDTLKRHQARRHGMVKNRNPCPICSKEFPDSTYHLKRHLEAHKKNTAKEYIPESKPTASVSTT